MMSATCTLVAAEMDSVQYLNRKILIPASRKREQVFSAPNTDHKKTRKSHNKVRTGCFTCKTRRKKCDETKPACKRCIESGRQCDGYPGSEQPSSTPILSSAASIPREPSLTDGSRSETFPLIVPAQAITAEDFDVSCVEWTLSEIDQCAQHYVLTGAADEFALVCTPRNQELLDWQSLTSLPTPSTTENATEKDDGDYDFLFPITPNSERLGSSRSSPPIFQSPDMFPGTSLTWLESNMFTYFVQNTGPSFYQYFDSSIWQMYAVQASLANTAVLHCAAALAAVHHRYTLGISREAFEYCAHALTLRGTAVRKLNALRKRIQTGDETPGDQDAAMVGSLLIALFESFQGNYDHAVHNLTGTVADIMKKRVKLQYSESRSCNPSDVDVNMLTSMFNNLARAVELSLGSPVQLFPHSSYSKAGTTTCFLDPEPQLPPIPKSLSSFEQARDFLFSEAAAVMSYPVHILVDPEARRHAQDFHERRLLQWGVACARMMRTLYPRRTAVHKRIGMLLKITKSAIYLTLYLTLLVIDDRSLDTRAFRQAVAHEVLASATDPTALVPYAYRSPSLWSMIRTTPYLSTNIYRTNLFVQSDLHTNFPFFYREHSVSFDSAMGPSRGASGPDSSAKMRHLCRSLTRLGKDDKTGLWEEMGIFGVAERMSGVEEHAVVAAVREVYGEDFTKGLRWIDVSVLMDERRLLVRYSKDAHTTHGQIEGEERNEDVIWTQEWWSF